MTVVKDRITLAAGDVTGLNYALMTLLQLFNLFKNDQVVLVQGDSDQEQVTDGSIIPVVISDQPQCNVRGVLLDMNPFGRVLKYVSRIFGRFYWLPINCEKKLCYFPAGFVGGFDADD